MTKLFRSHTTSAVLIAAMIVSVPLVLGMYAAVVYYLWNCLIPDITKGMLTSITPLQGLGLVLLARSLFGGFQPSRQTRDNV